MTRGVRIETPMSGFQPRAGKPVKGELLERQPWDAGNLVRTFFSGQLFPFLCVLARGLLRLKGGLRFFVLFFLFLNGWVLALKVSYFTIPNAGALLRNIFSSLPAVPLSCLLFFPILTTRGGAISRRKRNCGICWRRRWLVGKKEGAVISTRRFLRSPSKSNTFARC